MKRIACILLFLSFVLSAWADSRTVFLVNRGSRMFFYVPDYDSLPGLSDAELSGFVLRHKDSLKYVAPKSACPLRLDESEPKALVGFYYESDAPQFPLSVFFLSDSLHKGFLVVDPLSGRKDGTLAVIRKTELPPLEGVRIDNRYADWTNVPPVARFPKGFKPSGFEREEGGMSSSLPMGYATLWDKGGTNLYEIKALYDGTYANLNISAYSKFEIGFSCFFYLRSGREENVFTFEIPILQEPNMVYLWSKDEALPIPVGEFTYGAFSLEARVRVGELPAAIVNMDLDALTLEISTCFFDVDHYEEFYHTTLRLKQIQWGSGL